MKNTDKDMRMKRKNLLVVISILVIALSLLAFALIENKEKSDSGKTTEKNVVENKSTEEKTEEPTTEEPTTEAPVEVNLIALGDDLLHPGIIRTGIQDDGSYNFDFLFENISQYITNADIAVINQETIFGDDTKEFSGYPKFNSPTAVGDAIAKAGFNVVLHASNHARDMGKAGLLNCVEYWKTQPTVNMLGIHGSAEEQNEITVIDIKGIKFALLNYTYSHNAASFAKDVDGLLDMLCAYDKDTRMIDFNTINPKVLEDIKKADEMADVVIVFPHWGTEYTLKPTEQEKKFAKLMTEAGADLIIGTHPHVIQPIEWVEADNGNKALCYYSLGNFVSTQDRAVSMLGGMAYVNITKVDGVITIGTKGTGAIPLVTHYTNTHANSYPYLVGEYLLADYTEELAAKHGMMVRYKSYLSSNPYRYLVTKEKLDNWAKEVFGDWLIER